MTMILGGEPFHSASYWRVRLASGGTAVYELPPRRDSMPDGEELAQACRELGAQMAHEQDGRWYEPGGWIEITDLQRIALLERCAEPRYD